MIDSPAVGTGCSVNMLNRIGQLNGDTLFFQFRHYLGQTSTGGEGASFDRPVGTRRPSGGANETKGPIVVFARLAVRRNEADKRRINFVCAPSLGRRGAWRAPHAAAAK
uniref:Uncharacterized protein n=1 Tax=Trichuris muris TaxID=70415 RepID=A0A5S6QQ08_TRIMR